MLDLRNLSPVVFALTRSDGEYATISTHLYPLHLLRVIAQRVTRQWVERAGGELTVQSWRIGDKIGITIEALPTGRREHQARLA